MRDRLKFAYEAPNRSKRSQTSVFKQKREHNTTKGNWHNLLFWDFVYRLTFYSSTTFQKPTLILFSGKEAPNLVDPLGGAILSHWAP